MKREWSRYAPLGLVLAALAALAAGGLYIIFRSWNLPLQISLGCVALGLILYVVLAPGQTRAALTGRRARYGLNALVMGLAFIGIIVVINYLVYYNAKMNPKQTRWDLTEDKSNTLAPETIDALSKLPDLVTAQAFYASQNTSGKSTAQPLLDQYAKNGRGKFTYSFVDWQEKPSLAREAGITGDGQIVVKMGDRQELVSLVSEQELTSALIRLISNEKRAVYFLQGEGEYSPNATGDSSYSRVKTALEDKNYAVKTLNLRVDGVVPQDAKVIVIAGPQQPLEQTYVDLLASYLQNGGSVIVMEDPPITESGDVPPDPLADYLASTWGIVLGNDLVITLSANQYTAMAVAAAYGDHLITQKMGAYTPGFPGARSVRANKSVPGITQTELVFTTPNYQNCFPSCSWSTTDMKGIIAWAKGEQQTPPQATSQDLMGPIPLAVAAENQSNQARVVVYGNSHFASNAYQTPGNQDLLINSIDWCAKQETLINLTPKEPQQRQVVSSLLKYSNIVTNSIFLGAVIVLPGIVIFAGVVAWIVRRKRG
jgi:ABC-type uncharacterized transport system involved in gliding motility auxiliary subunit